MDIAALMVTLLVIRIKASLAGFLLSLSQDHGGLGDLSLTLCHKDKSVVNKIPSFLVTRRAAAPETSPSLHVIKTKALLSEILLSLSQDH
jgi:hypothetical protein